MAKKRDQYAVGYGKPPAHTRFQKGQSGNPSGKPRKMLSDDEIVLRELASRVTVVEGGKKKRMSKLEVMLKKQVVLAMQGDPKAVQFITGVYRAASNNLAFVEQEDVMRVTLVFEEEEQRRQEIMREDHRSWKDDPGDF